MDEGVAPTLTNPSDYRQEYAISRASIIHSLVSWKLLLWIILCLALFIDASRHKSHETAVAKASQPYFIRPLEQINVTLGRNAELHCVVDNLGGYKVGWVKEDTKEIQAIHDRVVTNNPRVSVTHIDHKIWKLMINRVQIEDRGPYMCQINTDPMLSQGGYLDVLIPPDIITGDSPSNLDVLEGSTISLTCTTTGYPTPNVSWRREDYTSFVIESFRGHLEEVKFCHGDTIVFRKIRREETGSYLCIASNTVAPSVSRRFVVNVIFPPTLKVPNQLVGAPLGTNVTCHCYVTAAPNAITFWMKGRGTIIVPNGKFVTSVKQHAQFEVIMTLIVTNFQKADVGPYICIARNVVGEIASSIRLYEIAGPIFDLDGIYDMGTRQGSRAEKAEEEKYRIALGFNKTIHDDNSTHVPQEASNGSTIHRAFLLIVLLFAFVYIE